MKTTLTCILALALLVPGGALADGDGPADPVSRADALALKTAVKSALAALGDPPAGYAQAEEEYDLPTEMTKIDQGYWLAQTDADFTFTAGKSGEQMGQEYQQKMMAAQAKGDYQEVSRLTMEFQQNMGAAMNAEMSKIEVSVALNRDPYQEIDPEGVLWEAPGAIALRTGRDGQNVETMLVFDPKGLVDTQSISKITLHDSLAGGSPRMATVKTIVVELTGPEAAVTEWIQRVDKGKMLALIGG